MALHEFVSSKHCEDCTSEYNREYYQNNKERKDAASKKWAQENVEKVLFVELVARCKRYGIIVEEYFDILLSQNGACAICDDGDEVLCIDHCHKTGKVRGILCRKCNQALGLIGDDNLGRASEYIEASK